MKRVHVAMLVLPIVMSLQGCASLGGILCAPHCDRQVRGASSSLVEYLYPKGELPPAENSVPTLRVPLRVGLGFLPATGPSAITPDAVQRAQVLDRIRERFKSRAFVAEIVTIPDYYLAGNRGFTGLESVQRLHDLDVMALVSYDQMAHVDENGWSLGYLTIVGAYVIKGTHHDVSTLVDLEVIDPASRSLVLRAGGVDTRARNTTAIDAERATRLASADGFGAATDQLIAHFDTALIDFEQRVRAGTANVRVVQRSGGSGGVGAMDVGGLVALLVAAMGAAISQVGSTHNTRRNRGFGSDSHRVA